MSTWLIICDNYNHLVEGMSVGFLHCKVSIFLFVADKYLGADAL